jgi:hypothetical protein
LLCRHAAKRPISRRLKIIGREPFRSSSAVPCDAPHDLVRLEARAVAGQDDDDEEQAAPETVSPDAQSAFATAALPRSRPV